MRGAPATLLATGLVLGAIQVTSSGAASSTRVSATALLSGGDAGASGRAAVTGTGQERNGGSVRGTGLTVRDGSTSARGDVTGGSARASAVARSVTALGGRVSAYGVRRSASATKGGTVYDGRIEGLKVDGRPIGTVTDARTYTLSDGAGRVVVNKGSIGLRVVLDGPAAGLPAGTDIQVAIASASVRTARPAPTATPTPTATATPAPERKEEDEAKPKARKPRSETDGKARKTGLKRKAAPKVAKRLTADGFAFPVYGKATFSDTFGAPRQPVIGTHQGNDIFAEFGAPVVAVADGVISKVGTLEISGNRLWLTTKEGDAFFYAHLSAFSPAAVDGRRVKAGTVLGFVGNTGDAEPTPPHVHFEVHPGGIEEPAVDPYRILLSWQGREDVPPGAWLQRNGADTTERPGALVAVRDFIAE